MARRMRSEGRAEGEAGNAVPLLPAHALKRLLLALQVEAGCKAITCSSAENESMIGVFCPTRTRWTRREVVEQNATTSSALLGNIRRDLDLEKREKRVCPRFRRSSKRVPSPAQERLMCHQAGSDIDCEGCSFGSTIDGCRFVRARLHAR